MCAHNDDREAQVNQIEYDFTDKHHAFVETKQLLDVDV